MNGEQKMWAAFWFSLAIVLLSLILAISTAAQRSRDLMEKMVAAGADPIIAGCALGFNSIEAPVCTLATLRAKLDKDNGLFPKNN